MTLKLPRRWLNKGSKEDIGNSTSAGSGSAPSLRLRVLQWNILADGLAQYGSFAFFHPPTTNTTNELTKEEDDDSSKFPNRILDWSYRRHLILEELLTHPPADFIALAELNHFNDILEPLKSKGYNGYFALKPKSAQAEAGFPVDGVGLFWLSTRWNAETVNSNVFDQGNANQVLAYGVFTSKEERGKKIVVAASHYKAKTGAANDATRLRHAQQTLDILGNLVSSSSSSSSFSSDSSYPVIFMGDLNTTPESQAVQLLSTKFQPVVPFNQDANGYYTTWKSRVNETNGSIDTVKRTIDYIFLSDSCKLNDGESNSEWRVVDRWIPFDDEEVGKRGLPSDRYPSDHVAVAVDLEWRGT